jgi:hypothetical protein
VDELVRSDSTVPVTVAARLREGSDHGERPWAFASVTSLVERIVSGSLVSIVVDQMSTESDGTVDVRGVERDPARLLVEGGGRFAVVEGPFGPGRLVPCVGVTNQRWFVGTFRQELRTLTRTGGVRGSFPDEMGTIELPYPGGMPVTVLDH